MNDSHAIYPVTDMMPASFNQKRGGFALRAAKRGEAFLFLDIAIARIDLINMPQTGGDGGIRTLGTGFTSTTV